MLHFNICLLSKNFHKIKDLLLSWSRNPEIIAIFENKLNQKNSGAVSLNNYSFAHKDALTEPGGVVVYIMNGLSYVIRDDLEINVHGCENLWVETKTNNTTKNLIIGVIHHHFYCNINIFKDNICSRFQYILRHNCVVCYIILILIY